MSNEFDPKKIIDFEKDYYNLLDLDKDSFPPNKTRDDKVKVSKLLESFNFRMLLEILMSAITRGTSPILGCKNSGSSSEFNLCLNISTTSNTDRAWPLPKFNTDGTLE